MKAKYWYIICILIIVGFTITPIFVKHNFLKKIEKEKIFLLNHGLKLTIIDEKGYLESIISFNLDIINGKKFRDYILDKPYFNNSTFSELAKLIKKSSEQNIRPALDGTTFNGVIKYSNSLLKKTTVRLSLIRFSDELMKNVYKDKKVAGLILPLLNKKILTFFITIDSKEKITAIKMKDIDRTLKLKDKKIINVKFTGNKLKIDDSKSLIVKYTFDNQLLKIHDKSQNILFQTKGFDYDVNHLNQFDSKGSVHIDSTEFKADKDSKIVMFKFGNIDIKSNVKPDINDTVAINISYALNDIYFKNQIKDLNLGKITLKVGILGMHKQDLLKLSSDYNTITFKRKGLSKNDIEALINASANIINKGFKTNINLSLSKLKFQRFMLNNITIFLESKLEKNTVKINKNDIGQLLNSLLVNGVITMDEKDLNTISRMNSKLSTIAKKEGNKEIFNIEFKQGKLFVNKKKL